MHPLLLGKSLVQEMHNPGSIVILMYGIAYGVVLSCFTIIEWLHLPTDLYPLVSMVTSNVLIAWLLRRSVKTTLPVYILSLSLFLSASLVAAQYILWAKFPDTVYDEVSEVLQAYCEYLTTLDILVMIWIFVDGIPDGIRRRSNQFNKMVYHRSHAAPMGTLYNAFNRKGR